MTQHDSPRQQILVPALGIDDATDLILDERVVLGTLLLSPDTYAEVLDLFPAARDYVQPEHAALFSAISGCISRGVAVTWQEVLQTLQRTHPGMWSMATLQHLTEFAVFTPDFLKPHLQRIRQHAESRRLQDMARRVYGHAAQGNLETARQAVRDIAQHLATPVSVVTTDAGVDSTTREALCVLECGTTVALPNGYLVVDGTICRLSRRGETQPIYSGLIYPSAIGHDLSTGTESLTVHWNGRAGGSHGQTTAPRAILSSTRGVVEALAARGAVVHPKNANEIAAFLSECTQENYAVLPACTTSERLGMVHGGLVLPHVSIGYDHPVIYSGRTRGALGEDASAYSDVLRAAATWIDPWAFWAIVGMALASPLIARVKPRRNPVLYLAGDSGSGKTTLGLFAIGIWGDPAGAPFQMQAHRTTAVGFRQTLTELNGLPCLIDEAHTASDPKRLESLCYEFANGQTYTRGSPDGRARGGDALSGTLLLAGEARPEFQHAGSQQRVLWIDCAAYPPLGAAIGPEHEQGKQRARLLEHAWEIGAGRFGEVFARAVWAQWESIHAAYRALRDDTALMALGAWRETLALAAVALDVGLHLVDLEPPDGLLDAWVAMLTNGFQGTEPASDMWDRLIALLVQCQIAEDQDGIPIYSGWDVLRDRGQLIAARRNGEDCWRVLLNAPLIRQQIGASAAQLYGRAWVRQGRVKVGRDGSVSTVMAMPAADGGRSYSARVLLVPVAALHGTGDDHR